jgi:T-complex protein 1 subunit theta
MAMHVPKAPGFAQMLKDGARHYHGLEEAVIRNIDACKELAKTTGSAFGPNGQNKMVINHLEKLFVTNDAATILRELEVEHPAAKMLVMASQQQEQECGDGTNFVLIFAGALLENAE